MKIFDFNKNVRKNEGKPKINIWLGKYRLASHLMKGQFFSNISDESIKENNIYICKSNCDIGQIDRNKFIENEIYLSIQLKVQKLFAKTKMIFIYFMELKMRNFLMIMLLTCYIRNLIKERKYACKEVYMKEYI